MKAISKASTSQYLIMLIVFMLALSVFPSMAFAAANTLAQNPTYATAAPGTSVNKTFGSSCTSGSRIVAILETEADITGLSISDGTNGAYAQDEHGNSGTGKHSYIFSVANTASSAVTVTASWTGSAYALLKIYEVTNAGGTPTLDAHNNGGGYDTTMTVSITTTAANATVFAGASFYPNSVSADTNYTMDTGPLALDTAYHAVERRTDAGAAGGITLTMNEGTGLPWAMAVASYVPPAGGGGGGGIRHRIPQQ